ncbi:Crp/Fnr family transcriptional regulator [Umezawaea sp. NPDC059074]|uniref:Crp/Fnr family transcriptional regulator n=1 Tax=Umezawaea sp. NPDC059074 TaxID=3346716 RepID=UPI00368CB8FD
MPEPVNARDHVAKLISESSFGTADVRSLCARTSPDVAGSVLERVLRIDQSAEQTPVRFPIDRSFLRVKVRVGAQPPIPLVPPELGWPAHSLLGRLRDSSRRELLEIGAVVRFPDDEEIIEQDATDTHALLLLDGVVKVQASDETGNTALLAIRVAGDIVGEMSALDGRPRSASVLTCGNVVALMISSSEFTAFLQRRNDAFIELFAMINDQLRWSDQRRRDFLSFPAAERVARVVCELVRTYGRQEPEGWVLGIPLTKVELASLAGMKPRTAEKAFSDLRKAGVVVSHLRRNVVVPDLDRLYEFSAVASPETGSRSRTTLEGQVFAGQAVM